MSSVREVGRKILPVFLGGFTAYLSTRLLDYFFMSDYVKGKEVQWNYSTVTTGNGHEHEPIAPLQSQPQSQQGYHHAVVAPPPPSS